MKMATRVPRRTRGRNDGMSFKDGDGMDQRRSVSGGRRIWCRKFLGGARRTERGVEWFRVER